MTSYELARVLLSMPELPVTHLEWSAGSDQWTEVTSADRHDGTELDEEGEAFGQPHIRIR